eukprot:1024259-Amphidinium_carterae.1
MVLCAEFKNSSISSSASVVAVQFGVSAKLLRKHMSESRPSPKIQRLLLCCAFMYLHIVFKTFRQIGRVIESATVGSRIVVVCQHGHAAKD